MDVYFNKNNSVKIQQEFFSSQVQFNRMFVLEFCQPSPTTNFMLMLNINLQGQRQNQCAQCGGRLFQLELRMEGAYVKRWALRTARSHHLATGPNACDWC